MSRHLTVKSQLAGFVRQDGQTFLAAWVSYTVGEKEMTAAVVFEAVANLLPRGTIGHGYRSHARGISSDAFRSWLVESGYEIIALIRDRG